MRCGYSSVALFRWSANTATYAGSPMWKATISLLVLGRRCAVIPLSMFSRRGAGAPVGLEYTQADASATHGTNRILRDMRTPVAVLP